MGVLLLGMGLPALICSGLCWRTYLESAFWKQVPARIEKVKFGTRTIGVLRCRYSYEFRGQKYRGTRVGIVEGIPGNIEAGGRRWQLLRQHKDSREPFLALVDPERPGRSLLFREASLSMYVLPPLGVAFAAVGALQIGAGAWWVARRKRRRELTRELRGRPWLFREDWREMCVRASNARELAVAWAWGVVLPLFACTLLFSVHLVPTWAKVVIWILAALAALAFANAVLRTVRQLVHGTPVLALTELPIIAGRQMVAAVQTKRPISAKRVDIALVCTELRGDGEAYFQELYRETLPVAREEMSSDIDKTLIPVVIGVPTHLPEWRNEPGFQIAWELEVSARTFPAPLKVSFDLPVFEADESEIRKRQA